MQEFFEQTYEAAALCSVNNILSGPSVFVCSVVPTSLANPFLTECVFQWDRYNKML
jgi:hypothetical protein